MLWVLPLLVMTVSASPNFAHILFDVRKAEHAMDLIISPLKLVVPTAWEKTEWQRQPGTWGWISEIHRGNTEEQKHQRRRRKWDRDKERQHTSSEWRKTFDKKSRIVKKGKTALAFPRPAETGGSHCSNFKNNNLDVLQNIPLESLTLYCSLVIKPLAFLPSWLPCLWQDRANHSEVLGELCQCALCSQKAKGAGGWGTMGHQEPKPDTSQLYRNNGDWLHLLLA